MRHVPIGFQRLPQALDCRGVALVLPDNPMNGFHFAMLL